MSTVQHTVSLDVKLNAQSAAQQLQAMLANAQQIQAILGSLTAGGGGGAAGSPPAGAPGPGGAAPSGAPMGANTSPRPAPAGPPGGGGPGGPPAPPGGAGGGQPPGPTPPGAAPSGSPGAPTPPPGGGAGQPPGPGQPPGANQAAQAFRWGAVGAGVLTAANAGIGYMTGAVQAQAAALGSPGLTGALDYQAAMARLRFGTAGAVGAGALMAGGAAIGGVAGAAVGAGLGSVWNTLTNYWGEDKAAAYGVLGSALNHKMGILGRRAMFDEKANALSRFGGGIGLPNESENVFAAATGQTPAQARAHFGGMGAPPPSKGSELNGYMPDEAVALLGQFGNAAGFNMGMTGQDPLHLTRTSAGIGALGAYRGQMAPGGGGQTGNLEAAVALGVRNGLAGSGLDNYLQTIAANTGQLRDSGLGRDVAGTESFLRQLQVSNGTQDTGVQQARAAAGLQGVRMSVREQLLAPYKGLAEQSLLAAALSSGDPLAFLETGGRGPDGAALNEGEIADIIKRNTGGGVTTRNVLMGTTGYGTQGAAGIRDRLGDPNLNDDPSDDITLKGGDFANAGTLKVAMAKADAKRLGSVGSPGDAKLFGKQVETEQRLIGFFNRYSHRLDKAFDALDKIGEKF